jgi:transposase
VHPSSDARSFRGSGEPPGAARRATARRPTGRTPVTLRSPEVALEGTERLYTDPPAGSVVLCLDEMGLESAESFAGRALVRATATEGYARERARQEIDHGRRGKGYVFGAFRPATGEALTECYRRRTTANWVDFLERTAAWVPSTARSVYAILDNLSAHRATEVLLFSLAHPRWEFVFEPVYAAYLNLIEPWWKVLRSLALEGRCFETWADIERAITGATAYWNAHRHPFVWGRHRRHRPRRAPGIALLPAA